MLRDASDWVGEFSLAERSMSESFSVRFRVSGFDRSVGAVYFDT